MTKPKVDVSKHVLVPKHLKLTEKEKKELFEKLSVSTKEFPKIYKNDPAIAHLEVNLGDIIKIIRRSPTAGESIFYRVVI